MKSSARWLLALLLSTLVLLAPSTLHAQEPRGEDLNWREQRTTKFAILYPAGEEAEAERYARFVDQVYDEVTAIFDHQLQTPITLRLYPTLAAYEEINPLAAEIRGVIAHAQLSRREISVLVPRTVNLNDEEIINNIRHEFTHLVVADLSDNNLPVGFHEGIAQYVERPGRDQATKVELLRAARDANQLMSWSELNTGTTVYQRPEIGYAQSVAVVSYLIDEYGFDRFVEFIGAVATSPGYRSALRETYGIPPEQLERAWLEKLPAYLDGRWKINALWAYDLTPLRELVAEGAYAAAESQLEEAIRLLETSGQTDVLEEARSLLDRSQRGQAASAAVLAARESLVAGEYAVAAAQLRSARSLYDQIGDRRHDRELAEMQTWADDGLKALDRLSAAEEALRANRLNQARGLALEAGATLGALGHEEGAARSEAVLASVDRRQRGGALALLAAGGLVLLTNLVLRWRDYRLQNRGWVGSI